MFLGEGVGVVAMARGDVPAACGAVKRWFIGPADLCKPVILAALVLFGASKRVAVTVDGGRRASVGGGAASYSYTWALRNRRIKKPSRPFSL